MDPLVFGKNSNKFQVKNGDRMNDLITRALEKHLLDNLEDDYCLVQLLPNGGKTQSRVLPRSCSKSFFAHYK